MRARTVVLRQEQHLCLRQPGQCDANVLSGSQRLGQHGGADQHELASRDTLTAVPQTALFQGDLIFRHVCESGIVFAVFQRLEHLRGGTAQQLDRHVGGCGAGAGR